MKKFFSAFLFPFAITLPSLVMSACNAPDSPDFIQSGPDLKKIERSWSIDVLIFNGQGTASADAQAVQEITESLGLNYELADSDDVDAMSAEDLRRYGVIVWPGGN